MKISKQLNFVIPIERADGTEIYVHSTPVDSACFKQHYRVLAKAFAIIIGDIGPMAGPRVAHQVLEDVARSEGCWESRPPDPRTGTPAVAGVRDSLVEEIRRLTNVVAQGARGWEPVPYHEALQRGLIEPEDASEIDAALAFTTVASHMFRERERPMMEAALRHWSARIESLTPTEWANSLKTSTAEGSIGEKTAVASLPRRSIG